MSYSKWIIANADKEKASALSEQLNIDPFIAFLLVSRGIDNELTASEFLTDSSRLVSPYSFKDMDKAADRINRALDSGEKICIYGDYDCDGVTATALLYSFLQALGADVTYFIPDRLTDGYGMNFGAIDKIKARKTDLIITVDNGIAAVDEAEYIYQNGMELVITDHHQIGHVLPRAEAVVNPHRKDNELAFRDFAGVGVAFKLACALYDGDADELADMYADFIAIGTIGDVVTLLDENRTLVKKGLKLINSGSKLGIEALKKAASSSDIRYSSNDVAFKLCPRINAAGRMSSASLAVELLLSEDYDDALYKAEQLNIENSHRHSVEEGICEDIENISRANPEYFDNRVIVVEGKNYHKGVIGISASHIVEKYAKPAIIIGYDDDGNATGSARSVEGFNIYEAISFCSDLLTNFGGHPLAAGLSLDKENIGLFRKKINEYARENHPVMPVPSLHLDCKLSPFYLTVDLLDGISKLEPYGAENSQPIFGLYNLMLKAVSPIGDGNHIKIEAEKKGKSVRMVKFRTRLDEFPYKAGDILDFAVKLSKNIYKGREYLSVHIVDCRKSGSDIDKLYYEKNDWQLFKATGERKTELYPDRKICAVLYKYLKLHNGYKFSVDDLYFEMCDYMTYGQLSFALEAFCQAGLITRYNTIQLLDVTSKVDLESTPVLSDLKGRL